MTTSSTKKRGGRTGAKKRASKAARKAAGTRKRPAAATRKPRATAKRKAAKTATSRTAKATRAEANGAATRPSALNAAAEVLRKNGQPMNCRALITAMAEAGLWTSPAGKTPHATLYSAIIREIATKGREARFRKVERGLFEAAT